MEWSRRDRPASGSGFYLEGGQQQATATLLLRGGRFAVEAEWDTGDRQGLGTPVALTDEAGTFWFFNSNNVELIVKVHDACVEPYQRYWVFMAGLTNLGVDVTVRDLVAGFEHTYHSDAGTAFPSVLDTTTFATCD